MSEPGMITNLALAELSGLLTSTGSFQDLMQQIAELATRTVPAATTCGITLAENGRIITVGWADSLARLLDEQQYELDEGPCLQALSTNEIVSAEDLTSESRWDGYPSRALLHGVQSIYSSPLVVNGEAIGALNLYADRVAAFEPESCSAAAAIALLAATTITAVLRHYDQATLTDNLRAALSSRAVIDQAIGVIIAMQHCSPEEAFGVLRAVSQHRNIPLREVAAELVANTSTAPVH